MADTAKLRTSSVGPDATRLVEPVADGEAEAGQELFAVEIEVSVLSRAWEPA